jgi:type II secretory pathway component GspD/PulD (secretin)
MMQMKKIPYALLSATAVSLLITGCAASPDEDRHNRVTDELDGYTEDLSRELHGQAEDSPKMEEFDSFYADARPRKREPGEWLKEIPFELNMDSNNGGISLRQVLRVFGSHGINIATQMSLDNYYYSGPSIKGTNAREAMRLLLNSMGVDYRIDDSSKSIEVTTMPRKTYTISLNNREASYVSGGAGQLSGDSGGEGEGGGTLSEDSGNSENSMEGTLGISANNNFWEALETELEDRCTMLVPKYGSPIMASEMGGAGEEPGRNAGQIGDAGMSGEDEQLVSALQGSMNNAVFGGERTIEEEQVCTFSLNANTGTVTVQGPRWLQKDISDYFDDLNATLNTSITIEAKILLFRNSDDTSEGIDLSVFAGSLASTGLGIRNNVLGGVTLGATGNRADISASGAIGNAFIGGRIDGAQAFIGWLEERGAVSIENEPVITTVSGVPTTFKRTSPVVYFRYNQQSTANEGGTVSVSINSQEVERRVGSIININPTYDRKRKMVRAQLGINQRYLTGFENDVSYLASGDSIQEVPIRIPLIEEIVLNGEILLKDGETVIVGGQRFRTTSNVENGVKNLRDNSILGGLFGSSTSAVEEVTYYTVLTVSVDEGKNELSHRL